MRNIQCDRCGKAGARLLLIPLVSGYLKCDLCESCIEQFTMIVNRFLNPDQKDINHDKDQNVHDGKRKNVSAGGRGTMSAKLAQN